MYIGQIIEATVEKLVFQGRGLIRYQGWVVFVDDVAPGEKVLVKIIQKKKSFYIGALQEVLEPSLLRVKPRCPYFGSCGGCQLQHLDYSLQVEVKEGWINEALCRTCTLPERISVVPAPKPWEYRRKITLHFEWNKGVCTLGYYARDNRTLLDVKECPIFVDERAPILQDLRLYFSRLKGFDGLKGSVTLLKAENNTFLLRFFFLPRIPDGAKEALKAPDYWASIWLESPREVIKVKENPFLVTTPHVFLQNFPEQAERLYSDVVNEVEEGAAVLDLYCGTGVLTQLLGKKAVRVHGVESNPESIRLAKAACQQSHVTFEAATVENFLWKDHFDTVIVNPPRIGLSREALDRVVKKKPKVLLYISCDPATLKRDIEILQQTGYKVARGISYDMFPQTTHLESFITLIS